ncbi:unnamed protein product [Leptosia nina]|uniref:Odorant receptor n=1 Tax=Leptosia nina TaxID=320188 RepID=A0AAV1JLG2_9NEOP
MEKIRKFNLNNCDLPTMLDNMDCLLRIANVKIMKNNNKPINILVLFLWWASLICYYYAYVFSMFWFVIVRYPETGDFVTACVMFSLVVCSQPSFITMLYMIIYKKDMQNLIESCIKFNKLVKPGNAFSKNLHIHLRYIKKRATVVWVAMIVNAIFYGLIPLAIPGRHLPEDNHIIYGLDPMFVSPNYEIAYVVMGICVYICALFLANITALNLVILGYVESQMIALSKELQNLWRNSELFYTTHHGHGSHNSKEIIKNVFINETLKEIIYFHIMNINIIKEFESVFRVTKAVEFMFIIFSIISELLGGVENTNLQITCTFVLIFMECLAGQKLIDASTVFERAVYNSQWENFDVGNQKIILLILPNTQKTLRITAGGMATLDFSCFLSVIKFSYSIYNTLRLKV